MVSDVPLGAFLSGGIDSSAVVAMMAKHSSQPVRTYSIGFEAEGAGALYNELPYARRVAELFATDHKEIIVRPDVAALLPKLLWHMDEPVADSAFITTYLVSEFARQDVKVILSGRGRRRAVRRVPPISWRLLRPLDGVGSASASPSGCWYRWQSVCRAIDTPRCSTSCATQSRSSCRKGWISETRYRHYVGVFSDPGLERLMIESHRPHARARWPRHSRR